MTKQSLLFLIFSMSIQYSFAQLTVNCTNDHTEGNNTYNSNSNVSTTDFIESAAIHTNNSNVSYTAGNYILCVDGFEIQMGTTFCADIQSCTPTGTSCFDASGLHNAFADFDPGSFTFTLSGNNVIIQTDGLPNHTSPYWSNTTQRCTTTPQGQQLCTNTNTTVDHPLFTPPTVTSFASMAPGNIDDFNGSYSLTVPISPTLAANSSSTGLGPIGLAVTGSVIYNDEEGPGMPIDSALPSLDFTGAHTGPQSYHYHLEPIAWSQDDGELIGIMSDGFFIYGRRDYDGTYPTNLDASGGHFGPTPHCPTGEYHYHIQNTTYIVNGTGYYLIFPDDYQGTPNAIL